MSTSKRTGHICDKCGKSFSYVRDLHSHRSYMHGIDLLILRKEEIGEFEAPAPAEPARRRIRPRRGDVDFNITVKPVLKYRPYLKKKAAPKFVEQKAYNLMKYCFQCGAKLIAVGTFCHNCGTTLPKL